MLGECVPAALAGLAAATHAGDPAAAVARIPAGHPHIQAARDVLGHLRGTP
jgi:hypothetical protein